MSFLLLFSGVYKNLATLTHSPRSHSDPPLTRRLGFPSYPSTVVHCRGSKFHRKTEDCVSEGRKRKTSGPWFSSLRVSLLDTTFSRISRYWLIRGMDGAMCFTDLLASPPFRSLLFLILDLFSISFSHAPMSRRLDWAAFFTRPVTDLLSYFGSTERIKIYRLL